MKKFIFFSLLTIVSQSSFAQFQPYKVPVSLTKAYIPQGFDTNDKPHIVVEGTLANTCDIAGETKVKVDQRAKEIKLEQFIYKYSRFQNKTCIDAKVPFKSVVNLDILSQGNYTVKNVIIMNEKEAYSKELGRLPIAEAKNLGDDYIYAIMDSVHWSIVNSVPTLMLRGQLPGPCWKLKEVKTIVESSDVVTVLPIIEYDNSIASICDTGKTVPFVQGVRLNTGLGRILIQVRSLNGQAVNEIVEL